MNSAFCILAKKECHELLKYGSFVAKYLKLVGVEIVVNQKLGADPTFSKRKNNAQHSVLLPAATSLHL